MSTMDTMTSSPQYNMARGALDHTGLRNNHQPRFIWPRSGPHACSHNCFHLTATRLPRVIATSPCTSEDCRRRERIFPTLGHPRATPTGDYDLCQIERTQANEDDRTTNNNVRASPPGRPIFVFESVRFGSFGSAHGHENVGHPFG
jgi:hypothetical protein